MTARTFLKATTAFVFISVFFKTSSALAQIPVDSIYSILKKEVDNKRSKSIIVGIVDANGRHVISAGVLSDKDPRLPDGNTEYEIGSVTKVVTSLVLADMNLKKQLSLSDSLVKFLPEYAKPQDKNVSDITLLNLATHTAGFPRFPDNHYPKNLENPYADYTVEQLFEYVSRFKPDHKPGSQFQYSNTGYSLLGQVMVKVSGKDYESLVKERVFSPLKMNSTVITLTPELKKNMATGHNEYGKPVANWDMPAVASNGALRSNVNDMLNFVAANLGLMKSDLYPAMELSHVKQVKKGGDDAYITLGWTLLDDNGKQILFKDGATAGYRSFVGFDKKKNRGVVVLSNTVNDLNDIAKHILDSTYALKPYQYQWTLLDTINSAAKLKGADAAITLYLRLKEAKNADLVFDERVLIYAGDELRKANKMDDAIKLYKFNLTEYPNSTQTYESLADLYTRTGHVKMAVDVYGKLLKTDPKNATGIWRLKRLSKP
ncbi:MAG TPA: serine hydrolase [Pedobacter sp.]|uniref:serine hydrolase n=1 Tax=Pedobacter sp. TaxID=1411316 RepID=UPI002B91F17F|nr:serine hydrolase [Pedobacter sp.]HMI02148.1 serine hydrolase [Pedobacter sp.]